ncbi:hypothetical protein [Nocardiopsis sp. CC223A]|uniref:hypothetical protein n=1 Tax=Nocardiopsis sp. CC223A TaxID=3044051 RepID=UPI00278BD368|nr:hypothetical protein [Nocardiopsis sp. CC223A]
MEHEALFDLPAPDPVPVVMCLDAQWYELMWSGQKDHEFRRRFLTGVPVQWFVYLTAPESRLSAVIDLEPAIEGTPAQIAQIAERMRPGNGATVEPYLAKDGRTTGYAMPIRRVRQYAGFSAAELEQMLDGFHPPQGYVLVDDHPAWRAVCDKLLSTPVVRETTLTPAP